MAYANLYRPDRLFLPQQKLAAFARTVPTPFYLYHGEGIRKSARLIRASFGWAPEHRAWYPLSANGCSAIASIFREEGFGALARSVPELEAARRYGFSEIAFHTAAMTAAAAQAAGQGDCTVIFDSPAQICAMESFLPRRCALRYHPDREPGRSAAASSRHKSGMDAEQILAAARTLREAGVEALGLHCHLGCGREEHYPAVAAMLFALAKEIARSGIRFDFIDLGGGVGVRSETDGAVIQLSRVGAIVRDAYAAAFDGQLRPAIVTELGRCAVARHGLLISRVTEVRERGRSYAILDMSTAQLPDLLLGGGQHAISVVGSCARTGRRVYSVHGCSPDARELICDRAILPALSPGTLVAIHSTGAYCESQQLSRCMTPPCGSYLYTEAGEFVPTA